MSTAVTFPSFGFFEALQGQVNANPALLDGQKPADAYFAVGIDDYIYAIEIEGRECVGLARGANPNDVDFFIVGSEETWNEMIGNILEHGGADSAHSLETLLRAEDGLELAEGDEAAQEAFDDHVAWLQDFFNLAKNLTVSFA